LEKFDLSGLYLQIVLSSFAENGIEKRLSSILLFLLNIQQNPKSESLCMHSQVILAQPDQFPFYFRDLRATSICPNYSKSWFLSKLSLNGLIIYYIIYIRLHISRIRNYLVSQMTSFQHYVLSILLRCMNSFNLIIPN